MKNKIIAFILAFSMVLSTGIVSAFAEGTSVIRGENDAYSYDFKEGETFIVNFMLDNNEGINNSTFRLKYDPNVIMAVENEDADNLESLITYGNDKIKKPLYSNKFVSGQLGLVPKEGLYDFEGKADGVKTSAQLGIIKFAQISMYSSIITEAKGDGAFLSMKFKMVNPGNTKIEILPSIGSNGPSQNMFYGLKNISRKIEIKPVNVEIKG